MDIKHRISFNMDDKRIVSVLLEMGIDTKVVELPGNGGNLITILIYESDPNWDKTVKLISNVKHFVVYGEGDQYETLFSNNEVRNAEWLRLISNFEQGYPQPKALWPLKQQSYEILCPKCAIYNQTKPMRLAKEPHLGKKSFMSLIWTNELFCTSQAFQGLAEMNARGYEAWDAVINKTDQVLEKVHQLFIPNITSPGVLGKKDLQGINCPACGTIKYYPHMSGVMRIKREAFMPNTDFLLTHEWFGHGLLAWREILVSNRVAGLILDQVWQGVRFKVVEVV
ncbi:MAG: hypothetical protein CVU39_26775 [Chloroflexi bacterium HGW-Chloroflexi-10]|nr:MAG: hypothetical protein CVU39_26775 [Chloroflexi bacterium HGW-Chloroflexi-10]